MKNETLLDRALFNFRQATLTYMYSTGDERELNIVGYFLQQCVELTIKHFLEISGVRYSHSHIIEDLLDTCDSANISINYSSEFYDFAPAISKWESKTRYIKNYLVSKKQIDRGFNLIQDFLLSNGVKQQELNTPRLRLREEITALKNTDEPKIEQMKL